MKVQLGISRGDFSRPCRPKACRHRKDGTGRCIATVCSRMPIVWPPHGIRAPLAGHGRRLHGRFLPGVRTGLSRRRLDSAKRVAGRRATNSRPGGRHSQSGSWCSPTLNSEDQLKMAAIIRDYRPGDEEAAYFVCLKTGNHGDDGEPFYRDDPDALGTNFRGALPEVSAGVGAHLGGRRRGVRLRVGGIRFPQFLRALRAGMAAGAMLALPGPSGDRSGLDSSAVGPLHVPPSGLLLPRAVRRVSIALAHRPHAARASAGIRGENDESS